MIQSQITGNQSKAHSYPKLMESEDANLIVLMTAPKNGVVVHASEEYGVGHSSDDWDMECFTDYNGTIELKNKN